MSSNLRYYLHSSSLQLSRPVVSTTRLGRPLFRTGGLFLDLITCVNGAEDYDLARETSETHPVLRQTALLGIPEEDRTQEDKNNLTMLRE